MTQPPLRALALLLAALWLTGCATVAPWQRGVFTHPCMQVTPRLGDAFFDHVTSVREGSIPSAATAVGCGCG